MLTEHVLGKIVVILIIFSLGSAGCRSTPSPTPTPTRPLPTVTAPVSTMTRPAPTATTAPASPTVAPTQRPGATPTFPTSAQATVAPTRGATLAPTGVAQAQGAAATPLREINWTEFLKTDPNLDYDPKATIPGQTFGPYVKPKGAKAEAMVGGYAVTDGVLYADISGDGREEAVISLFSGGTGGNFGLLIYREGRPSPILVKALNGYKIGGRVENGQLVVGEPLYAGWEGNCCPSGWRETRYRLQGDQMVVVAGPIEDGFPQAKTRTVEEFYLRLNDKSYQDAYRFLSPAFQARLPYPQWAAGYQNTLSINVRQVTDLPTGGVAVELLATDRTQTGQMTKRFTGQWSLIWSSERRQWLLDQGALSEQPSPGPSPTPIRRLRAVDWRTFLVNDPALEPVPVPSWSTTNIGPYVRVRSNKDVIGFANLDNIVYADMNGDGEEEAAIELVSGGTAGNLGVLVYRFTGRGPVLVTALPGYKIGATADNGQLLITQPIYAGWEPNCCPSGFSETRYRLQGNQLVVVGSSNQGIPQARQATVEKFYEYLNAKQYRDAYAFLSPAYESRQPYSTWVAGFANTVSVSVTTTYRPDGAIGVEVTATDRTTTGAVTKRFTGQWTLVWSAERKQWLLDRGTLTEVK